MINTNDINNAATTVELDEMVETAAFERNCELDSSVTYKDAAEFFAEEAQKEGNGQEHMEALVEILNAAANKFHALN